MLGNFFKASYILGMKNLIKPFFSYAFILFFCIWLKEKSKFFF